MVASLKEKFIATDPKWTICITHKHYQPTEMTLGLNLQYTSHSRHDAMTTTPSYARESFHSNVQRLCVCVSVSMCLCVRNHICTKQRQYDSRLRLCYKFTIKMIQHIQVRAQHIHIRTHTETFAGDKRVS